MSNLIDAREILSRLKAKRERIARARRIDRARLSALTRIESAVDDLNAELVNLGYQPTTGLVRRDTADYVAKLDTRVRNLLHNEIDGCARVAELSLSP